MQIASVESRDIPNICLSTAASLVSRNAFTISKNQSSMFSISSKPITRAHCYLGVFLFPPDLFGSLSPDSTLCEGAGSCRGCFCAGSSRVPWGYFCLSRYTSPESWVPPFGLHHCSAQTFQAALARVAYARASDARISGTEDIIIPARYAAASQKVRHTLQKCS